MNQKQTLVFLHIQKCAGTSFTRLLNDFFRPQDRITAHLLHADSPDLKRPANGYRLITGHNTWHDISAMPIDPVYITMLRHPVDRLVSLYYYWRSLRWEHIEKEALAGPRLAKQLSLEAFIASDELVARLNVRNGQARQFLNGLRGPTGLSQKQLCEEACERLDRCAFVGITEQFDRSVRLLCQMLGWQPPKRLPRANISRLNEIENPDCEPSPRKALDHGLSAKIVALNQADMGLYQYGCQRFESLWETTQAQLAKDATQRRFRKPLIRYRIRHAIAQKGITKPFKPVWQRLSGQKRPTATNR